MTIDEALELIKQATECLVIWRTDTGEILQVIGLPANAGGQDRASALNRMRDAAPGVPCASRFLVNPQNVTHETLEALCEEFRQHSRLVALRVAAAAKWARQPARELVAILETGDFPPGTGTTDAHWLVRRLFDFHWQELDDALTTRLWHLLYTNQLDRLGQLELRARLYGFERRQDEFVAMWMDHYHGRPVVGSTAMRVAGDLEITDPRVISDLVATIRAIIPFLSIRDAMVALGRIGPAAGEAAAQAIQAVVYDSSPWITALRDRVLRRIRTAPDQWCKCQACHQGLVHVDERNGPEVEECPTCYGLGYIELDDDRSRLRKVD